jgi:exportin-2 (importin alpha re-exporter)
MEALLRVINCSGADVLPFIDTVLAKLKDRLGAVCANPANPMFNHHLFNAIAGTHELFVLQ